MLSSRTEGIDQSTCATSCLPPYLWESVYTMPDLQLDGSGGLVCRLNSRDCVAKRANVLRKFLHMPRELQRSFEPQHTLEGSNLLTNKRRRSCCAALAFMD
jgi:hypothetical protein